MANDTDKTAALEIVTFIRLNEARELGELAESVTTYARALYVRELANWAAWKAVKCSRMGHIFTGLVACLTAPNHLSVPATKRNDN